MMSFRRDWPSTCFRAWATARKVLPGPGGTDAEDELVPLDCVDVHGLVVGAGIDLAEAVGDDDEVPLEKLRLLGLPPGKGAVDGAYQIRPGELSQADMILELLKHQLERLFDSVVGSIQEDLVSTGKNGNAQELLEDLEIAVVRSADLGQDRLVAHHDGQRLIHSNSLRIS